MTGSKIEYTLTMSKGTYVVSAEMALRILAAVRSHATDVTVTIDLLGMQQKTSEVTLIVSHIVSLTKHDSSEEEVEFGNLRLLRR